MIAVQRPHAEAQRLDEVGIFFFFFGLNPNPKPNPKPERQSPSLGLARSLTPTLTLTQTQGCAEMEALGASALGLNVDATGKQGWHPK
mmetsp:Transcript_41501/g.129930  ORF Transcript_41501/g.129930 Transcript_41501/m.129930 type:complete len:88 (+) Transcript_41501:215-478(+)